MTMSNGGLTKLVEECGELLQIAGKKIAYPDTDEHPDGAGSMEKRLEAEIADVIAACYFVVQSFQLDENRVSVRMHAKLQRFQHWHWPQDMRYFHDGMLEPSP